MPNTPALEKWQHARIRTIELPSGGQADVEPVDMTELIYGDPDEGVEPSVPNEFISIAEQTEYVGADPEKMTAAERISFSRYRRWLVADRTRRYRHADGSELSSLTPADVRKIPYDDTIAIFRVALHMDLSERLMLASFRGIQDGPSSNGGGKTPGDPPK